MDKLQKELSRLSDKTTTVADSNGALLQDFDQERVALIEAAENEALATGQPQYSCTARPVVGYGAVETECKCDGVAQVQRLFSSTTEQLSQNSRGHVLYSVVPVSSPAVMRL